MTIGKKVLCVCERGNSRSVALAYLLKDGNGYDALACGIRGNSMETFKHLAGWADTIILVDKNLESEIPEEFKDKLLTWDVGPDRFFRGFETELFLLYGKWLKEYGLNGDGRFY